MDMKNLSLYSNVEKFYLDNKGKYTEEGILWYNNYHQYIKKFDGNLLRNCAIFAIMSINSSLVANVKKFEWFHKTGEFKGLCRNKFEALIECDNSEDCILDILNGMKIKNFCMNLYNPININWVTIDRHAARIAGEEKKITKKKYIEIADAYKKVAADYYLIPCQLQAMTWVQKVS